MTTRSPILGPNPTDREAWLAERRRLITSTDIARIMRGEGWTVYREKVGDIEPFAGNEATEIGNIFQRPTLQVYAMRNSARVFDGLPLLRDSECPILAATPDAIAEPLAPGEAYDVLTPGPGRLLDLLNQANVWLVEAKTSRSKEVAAVLSGGDDESDVCPEYWIWQTQCQMACTGLAAADIAISLYGGPKARRVIRNPTLIDACRATATEYADRIARKIEPTFDETAVANQNAVKQLYGPAVGVTIDLSEEAAALWAKRQAAATAESAAKRDKDAYDAAVRHQFGNAEIGRLPDGGTLRLGTVRCEERIQAAYEYSRFWHSKPKAKKGGAV